MMIRTLLTLCTATLLTGCVVSFAPPAAMVPTATALAIDAQRQDGLVALGVGGTPPASTATETIIVAAVR